MIEPTVDDVLATVIDTFDRHVVPEVSDEYVASLCATISQLLRSVRARVAHEGSALHDDNRELRALLGSARDHVDEHVGARVGEALAHGRVLAGDGDGYLTVKQLQVEAVTLRSALVACIEAVPDPQHPLRRAARVYLQHQLERQQPWLVDAFTGPRR